MVHTSNDGKLFLCSRLFKKLLKKGAKHLVFSSFSSMTRSVLENIYLNIDPDRRRLPPFSVNWSCIFTGTALILERHSLMLLAVFLLVIYCLKCQLIFALFRQICSLSCRAKVINALIYRRYWDWSSLIL